MDLLATLRQKMNSLGDGEFSSGLRAVLVHIETAFRHLNRGQKQGEETAFTDAIYRSNQAFEGSIKEAYRVLANKDPAKERPYDIERYLEEKGVFRARVLAQFTNYRTEWRNPSTHDYKLDFDESEAFLAIVSVTAFACVLIDQMSEHLSFESGKSLADSEKTKLKKALPKESAKLIKRVTALIHEFTKGGLLFPQAAQGAVHPKINERQITGALAGFISSAIPDSVVTLEVALGGVSPRNFADLMVVTPNERVILEFKNSRIVNRINGTETGLIQISHYMTIGQIKNGILFFYPTEPCELQEEMTRVAGIDGTVVILRPKRTEMR